METISHNKDGSDYREVIVAKRVVRLYKHSEDITAIVLDTGETVYSKDSINTLEARLHSPDGRAS